MGVDSSQYRFKNKESLDTVLRLMNNVCKEVYEPKLNITITSNTIHEIQKIAKNINYELITFGLGFNTNDIIQLGKEIETNNEKIRTLNLSFPYDLETDKNTINIAYSRESKSTSAYINFNNREQQNSIIELSKFLSAINEYSEFGPETEKDINDLAKTIINLNTKVTSQSKWIFETGCITFEPRNDSIIREDSKTYKSFSGINVQFSKIHAFAYKAHGAIKIINELNKAFSSNDYRINITADELAQISIIDNVETKDCICNFYFKLDEIQDIRNLNWILENNECSIELDNARFQEETSSYFNVYLSGKSMNDLDFDLFIDIESSDAYKNKILSLFEGKLKYIGDG